MTIFFIAGNILFFFFFFSFFFLVLLDYCLRSETLVGLFLLVRSENKAAAVIKFLLALFSLFKISEVSCHKGKKRL